MATLKQFLATGELGPLHLGMSEDQVIACLGQPSDKSVTKSPCILKYGGLQLTFDRRPNTAQRVLALLGIYFRPHEESLPEPTRLDDFPATSATTVAEVREY